MRLTCMFLVCVLSFPALAAAITAGDVDDFQDGTLQGWTSGISNPQGPTNEADQGPGGTGDRALLATATGSITAGGKLVIFNQSQWTGDFLAAGVADVRVDLRNLGDVTLTMRFVLRSSFGVYVTDGIEIAPSATYSTLTFSLRPADLILVNGAADAETVLGNVTEFRFLHSTVANERGQIVSGQLLVDNVTALGESALQCASETAKLDEPADFLLLPGFEVDTAAATGLTTFFAVHNQTDEARVARVQYLDRDGSIQLTQDLPLAPLQTRTTNVRGVDGLAVDPDGVARGAVKVLACSDSGGELAGSLTGDYIYLDAANNFATGDQLLRREDVCSTVQVRLLDFGSGIRIRLYATDPQGEVDPTATFTVYSEAGATIDSGMLIADEAVEIFDTSELTASRFGTLVVELLAGKGAMSVEYSAFGKFSVAMNAICVDP